VIEVEKSRWREGGGRGRGMRRNEERGERDEE
jgi:hypothetical protein